MIILEAYCPDCNSRLEIKPEHKKYAQDLSITVEPCENCINENREEARKEAYEQGLQDARE